MKLAIILATSLASQQAMVPEEEAKQVARDYISCEIDRRICEGTLEKSLKAAQPKQAPSWQTKAIYAIGGALAGALAVIVIQKKL